MATRKGPVIYRVKHKTTKKERDMPETVYKHVKRHWDIIGQVEEGDIVPLNPSLPQQHSASVNRGNAAVAIAPLRVADDSEVLEDTEDNEEEQNDAPKAEESGDNTPIADAAPQAEQPTSESPSQPVKGRPGRKPKN